MLGPGHTKVDETLEWLNDRPELTSKSEMFCLKRAIWGSGATSRNGGGHDGWIENDVLPPTVGRGPLIRSLRDHTLKGAGVVDMDKVDELKIYVSQSSSRRMNTNFVTQIDYLRENINRYTELVRRVSGRSDLRVTIENGILHDFSAAKQIEIVVKTAVFVGFAGGGAMTAQFLPQGSSLILYHLRQDHLGKDDWKIFNFSPWFRTLFLKGNDKSMELFDRTLTAELINCVMFMKV